MHKPGNSHIALRRKEYGGEPSNRSNESGLRPYLPDLRSYGGTGRAGSVPTLAEKGVWDGRGEGLEVGVGTGKNIPYYPTGSSVFAIDLSAEMMSYARKHARQAVVKPKLILMDAQHLDFRKNTFDTIVATFVYCSVPDPIAGFRELNRVCKPDGRILLLEHVRSARRIKGRVMDMLNPFVVRLMGFNINRDTVENVKRAGLGAPVVDHLKGELFQTYPGETQVIMGNAELERRRALSSGQDMA